MANEVEGSKAFRMVATRVSRHLEESGLDEARRQMEALLPAEQVMNINAVLRSSSISYRDGLMIQLAYRIASPEATNLTIRYAGARTVGKELGTFLKGHHIQSVKDAYQNIGKNTTNLARGNFPEFDSVLRWASNYDSVTDAHIEAVFDYVCAAVAATARPVAAMPRIDRGALTFAATSQVLLDLFDIGSQGAYEQFTIAALLSALLEQTGTGEYRLETKNLNASDKSSRAAGDVQIVTGNRVVEAYEVTANDWKTKLDGAEKTVRDHDLTRVHIVASVEGSTLGDILRKLEGEAIDVSVLDLREFAVSLTAALTKPFRARALQRLYEYLDRYQPDVGRVNRFVQMIEEHGLKENTE